MTKRSTAKQNRVRPRTVDPPGARVVESFGAVGDLELHRLDVPIDFMCATCHQRDHTRLAATVKGSWSRIICDSCYMTLVLDYGKKQSQKQQRQKPKKHGGSRASAKRAQKALSGAPVVPRQRTSGSEPSAGMPRKHGSAATPTAGTQRMLQFFWAAGVTSWTSTNDDLYVSGEPAGRVSGFPNPDTNAWRHAVDQIAWRHTYKRLERAVANNALYSGSPEAFPLPQEHGFAITRGREQIAVIRATHASIPDQPPVYGNFLVPGPHWAKVAPIVADDADAQDPVDPPSVPAGPGATSPRTLRWRRVDKLPRNFDPLRAAACIAASQRIRLERQLDYPCPVILESRGTALTLEPITGKDDGRHVPFRLRVGGRSVEGKFLLRRHGPDPLPLVIAADVPDDDAIDAWVCALVGFADATCLEFPDPALRFSVLRPRSSSSEHRSRLVPTPRRLPQAKRWPDHLKPVDHWSHVESWVVAAHRRRLPKGRAAGADALERARRAAIVLGPGQTWVKAHFCGPVRPPEVRFMWEPTADVGL